MKDRLPSIGGFLAALVALFLASCARDSAPSASTSLVVVVTIDTLRADRLGVYGYRDGVSPFLDELAGESVVFEQAVTSMAHTAPSHTSLFTGLYSHQHGLRSNGMVLPDEIVTVAEVASGAGAATAAFVVPTFLEGLKAGFETFVPSPGFIGGDKIVDRGLEWLQSADPQQKVLLWLHLFDVHEWYVDGNYDTERAADHLRQLQARGGVDWFAERHHAIDQVGGDPAAFLDRMARYDGQIELVDEQMRRLLAKLRELRGEDFTLIITSDHGEGLGNHRWMGHGNSVYAELVNVPLLVHHGTGEGAGRRVAQRVGIVDLGPTILDLLGLPSLGSVPGRSYASLTRRASEPLDPLPYFLERRPVDEKRIAGGWRPGEMFGLLEDQWKLVFTGTEVELFDVEADPFEQTNLFDPENREHRERLRRTQDALALFEEQRKRLVLDGELVGVEALKKFGYL
ncbi:MAG: sulfatase [Acidobacteriota bacterium]